MVRFIIITILSIFVLSSCSEREKIILLWTENDSVLKNPVDIQVYQSDTCIYRYKVFRNNIADWVDYKKIFPQPISSRANIYLVANGVDTSNVLSLSKRRERTIQIHGNYVDQPDYGDSTYAATGIIPTKMKKEFYIEFLVTEDGHLVTSPE